MKIKYECALKETDTLIKPSLSEMMAALNGVTCAGVTAALEGRDTKKDPLAAKGFDAAMLSIDIKMKIINSYGSVDNHANKIMKFLETSRETLSQYQDTRLSVPEGKKRGTVKMVIDHIEDMMLRELVSSIDRPKSSFSNGSPKPAFETGYLPVHKPDKSDVKESFDAATDGMNPEKEFGIETSEKPNASKESGFKKKKAKTYIAPAPTVL